VLKGHARDAIRVPERLRLAARLADGGVFLPQAQPAYQEDGRWVSVWPFAEVIDADGAGGDPAALPWAEAGAALAALHLLGAEVADQSLPQAGLLVRLERAVAEAEALGGEGAGAIRGAFIRELPGAAVRAASNSKGVIHGDWHLGQLVKFGGEWVHLDPDDLGLGPPAWDLARAAAFWALGIIGSAQWRLFHGAYRETLAAHATAAPAEDVCHDSGRLIIVLLAAKASVRAACSGNRLENPGVDALRLCRLWARS
jgi:hypothetical protein